MEFLAITLWYLPCWSISLLARWATVQINWSTVSWWNNTVKTGCGQKIHFYIFQKKSFHKSIFINVERHSIWSIIYLTYNSSEYQNPWCKTKIHLTVDWSKTILSKRSILQTFLCSELIEGLFTPSIYHCVSIGINVDTSVDAWEWVWNPLSSIMANITLSE